MYLAWAGSGMKPRISIIRVKQHRNFHYPIRLAGDTSFATTLFQQQAQYLVSWKADPSGSSSQLSAASVYVLPAKYEPFGLSVLEAALSGCALVLGKH